jgi:hypothetical protein
MALTQALLLSPGSINEEIYYPHIDWHGGFPLPILAQCIEPLVVGADDIRGLWQEVGGVPPAFNARYEIPSKSQMRLSS